MTSMRPYLIVAMAGALLPVARALGAEGEQSSLFTGDLGNIFWSLLTFAAVILVLGKFAWKPILGALQKREDFIRDSLEQAKKDRQEAEARLAEYEKRLTVAKAEATAIIEGGRKGAEVVKRQINEEARKEAAAMIERAKHEIGIATDTAVKELYDLSANLATDVASRIIRKELDAKEHQRLIAEAIDEFGKVSRN